MATRARNSRGGKRAAACFTACLYCVSFRFADCQTKAPTPAVSEGSRAQIELDRGHLQEAEAILRGTVSATPGEADDCFLLGYVLFREGKAVESLAAYTAGAKTKTPSSDQLLVIASDYVLLKDLSDADHWLRYATQQAPSNTNAWYLLGRTEYNEDHVSEALTAFQRCVQLHPGDVRAEYNLGLAEERLQHTSSAIEDFQTAISWQQKQPVQDPQPYLDLGVLLLSQKRTAEALPVLKNAIRFGANNPYIQQELGLAYEAMGQDAEAVAPLSLASQLAPESEQPHFFLARVYRHLGRAEEAKRESAEVARLLSSHSSSETPNFDAKP